MAPRQRCSIWAWPEVVPGLTFPEHQDSSRLDCSVNHALRRGASGAGRDKKWLKERGQPAWEGYLEEVTQSLRPKG